MRADDHQIDRLVAGVIEQRVPRRERRDHGRLGVEPRPIVVGDQAAERFAAGFLDVLLDHVDVMEAVVAEKDAQEVRDKRVRFCALEKRLENLRLRLGRERRAGENVAQFGIPDDERRECEHLARSLAEHVLVGRRSGERLAWATIALDRMARRNMQARKAPPRSDAARLTHIDSSGRAAMVDVSAKAVTRRVAEASCRVLLSKETASRLHDLPKGDAIVVARLAGIQAAKRTSDSIPLAHPLPLDHVDVSIDVAPWGAAIRSHIVVTARTGAEMEAMAACIPGT